MFKVGDKVWSVGNGWGEVIEIVSGDHPIGVRYKHTFVTYTAEGKRYYIDKSRSLFFEEIPIPETATIRKKWRAEREKCYYFIESTGKVERERELGCGVDDDRYNIGNYFKTKEDAMESKIYKTFHEDVE